MKSPKLHKYSIRRSEVEFATQLVEYEKDYCPKTICEDFDDLEECYQNYIEKSKEGDD